MTDPTQETTPVAEGVEDPLGPPADGDDLAPTDADPGPADDPAPHGDAATGEADGPAGDPGPDAADRSDAPDDDTERSSVEELIVVLERTTGERDDYLDALRRTQAEFENYRKRVAKNAADDAARASETLVDRLLPVLDACDGAIAHGASEVGPIFAALLGTLEKEGLGRIDPAGEAFDPNEHEAVLHEPAGEGDDDGTVVSDVLRPGYSWKGRIVRPAMVKVRG